MTPDAQIFIPVLDAMELYPCTGLTLELVEQLAVRDSVISYSQHPKLGLLVNQQEYKAISYRLAQARKSVEGYTSTQDVIDTYNFNRRTLYNLINEGYIRRGTQRGQVSHEDVRFFIELARLMDLTQGKKFLPTTYNPSY